MTPRNTRTGGVLEQMVLPALNQGGYEYRVQVNIGQRLGCGQHFVDVIFGSGNGLAPVDDDWFTHAVDETVLLGAANDIAASLRRELFAHLPALEAANISFASGREGRGSPIVGG